MQRLTVIAGLIAIGWGFQVAGVLGALTGLIGALGTGSGLSIAAAESGTSVSRAGPRRSAQRLGGFLAALGSLVGALYGGWQFGWAWAIAGYIAGAASGATFGMIGGQSTLSAAEVSTEDVPEVARGVQSTEPPTFDLNDRRHVALIDAVRRDYGELLGDDSRPYADCMYRPAVLLPYSKPVIRGALTALLDFCEGRRPSSLLTSASATPQFANLLRANLDHLDDFLDVSAEQLPIDPVQNARKGLELRRLPTSRSGLT